MRINATVPVRVVIDPNTAQAHLDQIDDALTEAATRALHRARTVIEQYGADPDHHVTDPVLSWSGAALPSLDAAARQRIESVVGTALATAHRRTFPAKAAPRQRRRGPLPGLDWVLARLPRRPKQAGFLLINNNSFVQYRVWDVTSRQVFYEGHTPHLRRLHKEMKNGALDVTEVSVDLPASGVYRLRYMKAIRGQADLRDVYLGQVGPEKDPAIAAKLVAQATAWAARLRWVRSVLLLEIGGQRSMILAPDDPADLDAVLLPIDNRTGGGGVAKAAAPPSTPDPSGEPEPADTDQHVWPDTGTAGEPLVCEPFLHEPAATHLVDDHGLPRWMHRIAADLDVPECRYLGMFAYNCAQVIAARAWAIGVASSRAHTRTRVTFRRDGKGNNGFVDIRPGDAAELSTLKRLARIAANLHAFGEAVITAYRDPHNAALVRPLPDAAPNPVSWAGHFCSAFRDRLVAGYLRLYSETCRVLLLQQLRSSSDGIEGRLARDEFDKTVRFFTDTLDTLGKSAFQLSTLRAAIQHSRTVHVTGSVREVLSESEIISGAEGAATILPPPIESVPPDILALIGDARVSGHGDQTVVRYGDRDWTENDLDEAIGLWRGFVNMADPVFLHVRDLDQVFERAQHDRTYPTRFLLDLLTTMRRVNREMTAKAAEPIQGAFFALEASQYVRKSGGAGWHGLRFDLQGIHQLADDQLRPQIGDDPLYVEGVNVALSIKADVDDMIAMVANVGVFALAMLCAPVGGLVVATVTAASSIGLAARDVSAARRKRDMYDALLKPEAVQKWQDLQLAELMADLSVAFAVFDIGGVVGESAKVITAAARGTLTEARLIARAEAREAAERGAVSTLASEALAKAYVHAVTGFAIAQVMNVLVPEVIRPVLEEWLTEQAREHGTLREVTAILSRYVDQGAAHDADR